MNKKLLITSKILATTILLTTLISNSQALAGTLLVANVLSNSVSLFNEATRQPINEIKVGFMPHEVVVAPNGKIAVVSNYGDLFNLKPGNSLSVIDIASARVLQTIQLPDKSRPHGIAFISNTQALVTAEGIQSLLVVDIANGTVNRKISLPDSGAHIVNIDAETRFSYIASVNSGVVLKIDLKDFSVAGKTKVGNDCEGLALTPEEDLLLVTDRKKNYVAVLRTKDLSLLKKIETGKGPGRVVMFDHGKSAVIANTISGTAQVIDMASLTITKTFNTMHSHFPLPVPVNMVVREGQQTAYITNFFADRITLVDLIKGEVLKTFSAGYLPDGIAISAVDVAVPPATNNINLSKVVDINYIRASYPGRDIIKQAAL